MDEDGLEKSITDYETQLTSIKAAILVADDDTKLQLEKLSTDLQQLIEITKDALLSAKKQRLLNHLNQLAGLTSPVDDKVSEETESTELNLSTREDEEQENNGLDEEFALLEGSKCRAPFSELWGELSYHNAVVLSVEASENISTLQDIMVRVMFCNPITKSMKPCPFFLEGNCKFPESCRFSHGHVVKFEDLKEFHNPDYATLERDSKCLAQFSDNLWYKATVEEVLEDHKYRVKYERYEGIHTLNLEEILPLEHSVQNSSDSEDESNDRWNNYDATIKPIQLPCIQEIGDWEKHTKGIGSKLMEKMGYVLGQGLGKKNDGRTQPVEAFVFPAGKSLDKCLEIREKGLSAASKKKLAKKEKRMAEKIAARYEDSPPETVFDFLNKKLSSKKHKASSSSSNGGNSSESLKSTTTQNLNFQSMQVGEDIKKLKIELHHLQKSLVRNVGDKLMTSQIQTKIIAKEEQLRNLQQKEKSVINEQKSRQSHQKLTIF